jgi:orotate phosphoribosyltransferase
VPVDLELYLSEAAISWKTDGGSSAGRTKGIFLDFSLVEWVDLSALVSVIVLVERALRDGLHVTVALPLCRASYSEMEHLKAKPKDENFINGNVNRRVSVLRFLKYLRFEQALHPPHLQERQANLTILSAFDPTLPVNEDEPELPHVQVVDEARQEPELEYSYKFTFPLTWLSAGAGDGGHSMARFLANVLHGKDQGDQTIRGLEAVDADTLTNVILYELLDNVKKHSGLANPAAIVTAWARPRKAIPDSAYMIAAEKPYVTWLRQRDTPVLEIIVGDSGDGVVTTLGGDYDEAVAAKAVLPIGGLSRGENVLIWAFDRWSSSKTKGLDRGTRGLYRVDRIVKEYQGMVSIRCGEELAGFDHGGPAYDHQLSQSDRLCAMPGTTLHLWLPPFRETPFPRQAEPSEQSEQSQEIFRLGELSDAGVQPETLLALQRVLQSAMTVFASCSGEKGWDSKAVESLLRKAAELRHPNALVICEVPGAWDSVAIAIDSVNAEHEIRKRHRMAQEKEHFEIWDPVLVLGRSFDFGWVGAGKDECCFLNALVTEGGTLSPARAKELIPDEQRRHVVLKRLRNDTSLVQLTDHGDIRLLLGDPWDALCKTVSRKLEDYVVNQKGHDSGVSQAEGSFRTPTLHLVQKWLDVDRVLENTVGRELAIYALSTSIRRRFASRRTYDDCFILSDSKTSTKNIKLIQDHLGIRLKESTPSEMDASIPTGVRIIDLEQPVILYFDILSSGESAIRALRQVLRDEGMPLVVACLFDARENRGSALSVLGVKVPVVPLVKIDVSSENREVIADISPNTLLEEGTEPETKPELPIKADVLSRIIESRNALHFSHIGRPIGRHFTFYLDAHPLLEEEKIHEAFERTICDWLPGQPTYGGEQPLCEVWYPQPEPKPTAPAQQIAKSLIDTVPGIKKMRSSRTSVGEFGCFLGLGSELN